MSELYQIANDEWLLVLKKYIGEGRGLLPVTIDYEAAEKELGEFAISLLTDPIENDAEWTRRVVDAALGASE